jgi:hypothetical protein
MYLLPHGDPESQPGVWTLPDNEWLVATLRVISCPKCGRRAMLNTKGTYRIDSDGWITPDWACQYIDCEFHDCLRLIPQ